jgi:hypothetical protein
MQKTKFWIHTSVESENLRQTQAWKLMKTETSNLSHYQQLNILLPLSTNYREHRWCSRNFGISLSNIMATRAVRDITLTFLRLKAKKFLVTSVFFFCDCKMLSSALGLTFFGRNFDKRVLIIYWKGSFILKILKWFLPCLSWYLSSLHQQMPHIK